MDNNTKAHILELLKENQDTDIIQVITDWADSPQDRYIKARRWVDINDAMKKAVKNTSELSEIYILANAHSVAKILVEEKVAEHLRSIEEEQMSDFQSIVEDVETPELLHRKAQENLN
jgi:hypothetical protein